mmetsp:Transcript_3169/g.5292  ORF Transcript_3169/g.5292 Transcript_3169/m.5292 type:complete len:81 (+) Transcript_3169:1118-1360(+)
MESVDGESERTLDHYQNAFGKWPVPESPNSSRKIRNAKQLIDKINLINQQRVKQQTGRGASKTRKSIKSSVLVLHQPPYN